MALKKGSNLTAIWNDYDLTNKAFNAFAHVRDLLQDAFPRIHIPRCPQATAFRMPDDPWGTTNRERLPNSHRQIGAAFEMDRILPIPQPLREALISLYFDPDTAHEAKNDEDNKACLIRIYLGQNEHIPKQVYDSLRNFPLWYDMLESLDFNMELVAAEMAIALAVLHWEAGIDGMDLEYILGSARATAERRLRRVADPHEEPHSVIDELVFTQRSIHLWVLDFDKCKRFEPSIQSVTQNLVPAFLGNDSYYPRPDIDQDLWVRFGNTYRKASRVILENKKADRITKRLPQHFLDSVVSKIKETADWDPGKDILFG